MKIELDITKDQILDAVQELEWSAPEKIKILETLFPSRGYVDKSRLIGDVTTFICENK